MDTGRAWSQALLATLCSVLLVRWGGAWATMVSWKVLYCYLYDVWSGVLLFDVRHGAHA